MTGKDIRKITVLLFLSLAATLKAQTADSSIFNKPLQIEATVKTEKVARSEQKGDTLIFNAAAYQVVENSDSERLISKMPGIAVSDTGIEANGKEVARIMLDGQEFFGNDPLTALRNVPADMVKQIEVINKLSDSAQLTGVDDGEGYTAINIVTKRKKGSGLTTGRIYGSYGIPDKDPQAGKYIAGGNMSHFTDKRSLSVIGMSNNISKFNFPSSDIVSGATGLDAEGGSSFKVKSLAGISRINSLGINYTDKVLSFSYFFNDIHNNNHPRADKYTMTANEGEELHTHSVNDYRAHNMAHKFDGKITLSPSKKHSFIIRPTFSFDDLFNEKKLYGLYNYVYTDREDKFQRHQINKGDNDRWSFKGAVSVNYRYKFDKRKRSLSIFARYGLYRQSIFDRSWEYRWSDPDADLEDLESAKQTIQKRDRMTIQHSATAKLTYSEPLSRRSLLAGEFCFKMTDAKVENLVFPFSDGEYATEPKDRVSAINRAAFYQNLGTIRYNYVYRKINISASATYQHTIYNGSVWLPAEGSTYRSFHHPLYTLTANIPIDKSNTLRIEAKGKTQNPGPKMLQDVVDRSSTSNVKAGNPDLTPAYLHEAEVRYINTNKKSGTTFSFTATYTGSDNYFCDSLVINRPDFVVMTDENGSPVKLGKNNQYVKPINMDGYHKLYIKSSFAVPVDFIRCNFNLGAQVSTQRIPGMINEEKIPINRNWYQISGRLDSNISKDLDFTISYNARYTTNEYNGKAGSVSNNFISHRAMAQIKWIFLRDYTFTGAFVYKNFRNTEGRYNDHFYLCDLFIGRRLLKSRKLEVNVGVNDLLDNNKVSFGHSVSASGRTDTKNIGIGRYFSVQAIWHFKSGTRPEKIIKHD